MTTRYEMKAPSFDNVFDPAQLKQLTENMQPEIQKATSSRPQAARDRLRQRIKQKQQDRLRK